jgi:methionyl-tRNA formyltransferase
LIGARHHVVACVTQPDRPKGRGMKVVLSEIKERAQAGDIPVLQPGSLKEDGLADRLKEFRSDVFVVIAYGKFLPAEIINIPPLGAVNVHASLLPKYRGAAPINWAIINGETETGLSIIKINETMDAGDILSKVKIKISDDDTSMTLKGKMMEEGPLLLRETLDDLAEHRCVPQAQDHSRATLAPKLIKGVGAIQWAKKAEDIDRMVRGLLPWPSAYTFYNEKLLKILEAKVVKRDFSEREPGTVTEAGKEGIVVAAGTGGLLVTKVHLQDSKSMDAHDFMIGHQLQVGFQFK